MFLSAIPLNGFDEIQKMMAEHSHLTIQERDDGTAGAVLLAVNDGIGDGFIEVNLRGREQYVLFNVFVAKIRRESSGMVVAEQQRRVAWAEMAQAFISEYGEASTPRDIKECLGAVRFRWITSEAC